MRDVTSLQNRETTPLPTITMFLRCFKLLGRPALRRRTFSSAYDNLVQLETRKVGEHEVAVVTLNNPPVNSFTLSLLNELNTNLRALNSSPSIKGLVLSSSSPVFSAGIDFNELYRPNPTRLKTFWTSIQRLWKLLYPSSLVTIAAINGHCLAGGTLLAASCDYRVAQQGTHSIGVPAVKVGMTAPYWFQRMLVGLMGQQRTEMSTQQGTLYSPSMALDIGLVDEVYEGDNLVDHCLDSVLPRYLNVFEEARVRMKLALRGDLVEEFQRREKQEAEEFVQYLMQSSVQQQLETYMNALKQSKDKQKN